MERQLRYLHNKGDINGLPTYSCFNKKGGNNVSQTEQFYIEWVVREVNNIQGLYV